MAEKNKRKPRRKSGNDDGVRTLKVDVWVPPEGPRPTDIDEIKKWEKSGRDRSGAVIESLQAYRFAAAQVAAVMASIQFMGADIAFVNGKLVIRQRSDAVKTLMATMFGDRGSGMSYNMCEFVKSDVLQRRYKCFVWENIKDAMNRAWTAPDPDPDVFPRRGQLILESRRDIAAFKRLGITIAPQHHKLCRPDLRAEYKIEESGIKNRSMLSLYWDEVLGPVTFRVKKLESGRWAILNRIFNGEYASRSITLTCDAHSREIFLLWTYEVPRQVCKEIDPETELHVSLGAGGFVTYVYRKDRPLELVERMRNDGLLTAAVVQFIDQMSARQSKLKAIINCSRAQPAVVEKFSRIRDALTTKRDNLAKHYNHLWSKWLVALAIKWRCGKILFKKPKLGLCSDPNIEGHRPWQWSNFVFDLQYKAKHVGIATEIQDALDETDVIEFKRERKVKKMAKVAS